MQNKEKTRLVVESGIIISEQPLLIYQERKETTMGISGYYVESAGGK